MRFLGLLFLLLTTSLVSAQKQYSSETLQQFTNLYLDAKDLKSADAIDMQGLLDKHEISADRYRALLHLSLVEELPELRSNELAFIEELKQLEGIEKRKTEEKLKAFCDEQNFDFDTYQELVQKYKTDIKFQRSLKPYFDISLNRN